METWSDMEQIISEKSVTAQAYVPELAVVIPTFNERENIEPLGSKLRAALSYIQWEVVFVDDDSTDGTVQELEKTCRQDSRFRCIRRVGRRGLSSAVVEGIQSTFAPLVAVMDADLQHDETLLVPMFDLLRQNQADLVVGSRYVADAGTSAWDERRVIISRVATRLSQIVLKGRRLNDPMSGFFMIRRGAFEGIVRGLSQQGYKILVDIVASSPQSLRIKELPYVFGQRRSGTSKLDPVIALEYLMLLLDKLVGRWFPSRFVMFAIIGCIGVVSHMTVLAAMLATGASFLVGQSVATTAAIAGNFFLNNLLTYRDRRIKGFGPLLLGLVSFYAVCLVGAIANVGIANFMFVKSYSWWISGVCGILVGAVWNYAASSVFTWRR
jgi:dolichol-phosphate mannosyltransferase